MKSSQQPLTPNHPLKYIIFTSTQTQQKWKIDSRLLIFSQFLAWMDEEIDQTDPNCVMTVLIPAFITVNTQLFTLIGQFIEMNNFEKESIRIGRIKMTDEKQSLDEISHRYIEEVIKKVPDWSQVRKLLNLCEYLRINSLKELLCFHIATKHFHKFNANAMDREIEERQLFYNRQMDINLKKNMITYARQFGKDVLENYQSHVLKNAKPKV